ncbi:methyltransferase domain-containing protein [Perkinsela sp. CCAP 1560/4]|nr:methyltransferase domain-containing protein [Perkinsela sp. CCAP 1560/4]|eukprot:KNH07389.1 methyltransferase domain-containing protein [Perkinsela sp. CCAP 1560/4]
MNSENTLHGDRPLSRDLFICFSECYLHATIVCFTSYTMDPTVFIPTDLANHPVESTSGIDVLQNHSNLDGEFAFAIKELDPIHEMGENQSLQKDIFGAMESASSIVDIKAMIDAHPSVEKLQVILLHLRSFDMSYELINSTGIGISIGNLLTIDSYAKLHVLCRAILIYWIGLLPVGLISQLQDNSM